MEDVLDIRPDIDRVSMIWNFIVRPVWCSLPVFPSRGMLCARECIRMRRKLQFMAINNAFTLETTNVMSLSCISDPISHLRRTNVHCTLTTMTTSEFFSSSLQPLIHQGTWGCVVNFYCQHLEVRHVFHFTNSLDTFSCVTTNVCPFLVCITMPWISSQTPMVGWMK